MTFLHSNINKINNLGKSFVISPSVNKENYINNLEVNNTKNEIHYSSSQNEWYTSSYFYNKNYIKNLPSKDINIYKLFSAYFNMKTKNSRKFFNKVSKVDNNDYTLYLESDIHEKNSISLLDQSVPKQLFKNLKKRKVKKTRFTVKKTFISKPQSKHLNHKVIITISLYNREMFLLKKKIFKIFKRLFFKKKIIRAKRVIINKHITLNKNIAFAGYSNIIISKNPNTQKKGLMFRNKKTINSLIYKHKNLFYYANLNLLNSSNININSDIYNLFLSKKEKLIKYYIYNKYKHLLIFKHYVLMWSLYNYKFNNNNLIGLRNIISKIYNKTPFFNLINLKYFYLDSNIIASLITKKLKDRKKKVLIVLKRALAKVKKFKYLSIWNGKLDLNNLLSLHEDENKLLNKNLYSSILSPSAKNMVYYKDFLLRNKKDILSVILFNTKHKVLNGIRLEGGGRLTKRLTALRSVSKTKYVGSLKNINSSTLGLSTIMLKGYCKSNLQYTNINSYNRNGSFGVKASIASF